MEQELKPLVGETQQQERGHLGNTAVGPGDTQVTPR